MDAEFGDSLPHRAYVARIPLSQSLNAVQDARLGLEVQPLNPASEESGFANLDHASGLDLASGNGCLPYVIDSERPAPSRPAHLCYNDVGVVRPTRHPNSLNKGYLSAA